MTKSTLITTSVNSPKLCLQLEAEAQGDQPHANTALLSAILMFGTFFIAYFLRIFRNSKYLGRNVSDIKAKPAKLKNELKIITKFKFLKFFLKMCYTSHCPGLLKKYSFFPSGKGFPLFAEN